jgi:hypothetical protein
MAFQLDQANILLDVNTVNQNSVFDYLRPNAFRFVIKDIPKVAYTCQSANLPGLQLGFALQPTPFIDLPRIGDKLQYDEFTIRFLIAEDMSNYIELLEWLVALGFPETYNSYTRFVGERLSRFPFIKQPNGSIETAAYSDGTLTVLDSANIPKTNIILKDMFPVAVQALDYDITSSSVEFLVGIASFKYRTFEIQTL